jgi:hypothetical protein
MAYVQLPLTGTGDATARVAVDEIGGDAYQIMKLFDGGAGSTVAVRAVETTPGSTDAGMIVRPIGSTAFPQAVVGTMGITSGSSEVALSSIGSTRLVGQFTVANPTTAVSVANPTTAVNVANQPTVDLSSVGSTRVVGTVNVSSGVILGPGSSANTLGAVAQGAGSTSVAPWYVISTASAGAGSTVVDAQASSEGSTRLFGKVDINAITSSTGQIGSVALASGTTGVMGAMALSTLSTGLVGTMALASGGTTGIVGSVVLASGSTSYNAGSVVIGSGSTSFVMGAVAVSSGVVLGAGSTTNSIGSVALVAGSSANTVGAVAQGPGSSGNVWTVDGYGFSSGNIALTTINSSAESSILAANANRKAAIIQNLSTGAELWLGFSTAALTTSLGNVQLRIPAAGYVTIGGQLGNIPLIKGPIRGRIGSTTLAGPVAVSEFT